MKIDLSKRLEDCRVSRVVIGLPFSTDISSIFENEELDFLTSEPITHENFDMDDVYYIDNVGYTRRESLFNCGFVEIECNDLDEDIKESMLRSIKGRR